VTAGIYRESNTTDNYFVAPNTGNSLRKWYGSYTVDGQNLTYLTRKESRFLKCALELVLDSLSFKHSTTHGSQVSVITTDYV